MQFQQKAMLILKSKSFPCCYLLAQSQQSKHENKMQNLLKVNTKRTNQYNQYHYINMAFKWILQFLKSI